ncbi:MAG TPA: LemA family protein [Acidimicrobiales bacterium]|nr:LemA family protein [Acidimicrobiales bacterium]
MVAVIVVVLLLIFLVAFAVRTFNRLVKNRNSVADAWAGIDVQLTRRADLVPNLVEVVKGYKLHEQQTLESVVAARTQARGAAATGAAEEKVGNAVGSLIAVAEAYPDLKANTNFQSLQNELATLEEDLSFARRYYNGTVRNYNTAQQTFPTVLFARALGFSPAEYFQADLDAKDAPSAAL